MQKIIYQNADDQKEFDIKRFKTSVNKYAKISDKEIEEALKELECFPCLHVSRLVETAAKLIEESGNIDQAKKYIKDHAETLNEGGFERLRRITGYLVGSLDRWNDGKKAEEAVRVKHNVNSSLDDNARTVVLQTQALAHNIAYQQ